MLLLTIVRAKPRVKGVRFQGEPNDGVEKSLLSCGSTQIVQVDEFCGLLARDLGPARIRLKVDAKDLIEFDDAAPPDNYHDVERAQSISLADALKLRQLTTKMRIILAFILARSVWQFYDSDWIKTKWTSERIHFMLERNPHHVWPSVYACNPCFAFTFDDSEEDLEERCELRCVVHRYPRILALAVVLAEIGGAAPSARVAKDLQSLEAQINRDFCDGGRPLNDERWPDFESDYSSSGVFGTVAQVYRSVVESCLDRAIFTSLSSPNTSWIEDGVEERRGILYERIVYPLENLVEEMGWRDALGKMEPMRPLQSDGDSWTPEGGVEGTSQEPIPLSPDRIRADAWVTKIMASSSNQRLCELYKAKTLSSGLVPRVKVAILDTGYDKESPFFKNRNRTCRIRGWKDFVDDGSEKDDDGHGTFTLSLVMKIAPTVDIFVARIARGKDDLQTANHRVAQAIRWATDICDVDIVSMSFGFPGTSSEKENFVITKEVRHALNKKNDAIIFLAAAANEGANRKEMFPANHRDVISMRGTNALGVFEDFNPPAGRDSSRVFGTLGKDVCSAWLNNAGHEATRSGTSVATAIAAGIAASVLGSALLCIAEGRGCTDAALLRRLWTRSGMLSMFNKMSTCVRERCFYLNPLNFMTKTDEMRRASMMDAAEDS